VDHLPGQRGELSFRGRIVLRERRFDPAMEHGQHIDDHSRFGIRTVQAFIGVRKNVCVGHDRFPSEHLHMQKCTF
jgi:hypothetical protein